LFFSERLATFPAELVSVSLNSLFATFCSSNLLVSFFFEGEDEGSFLSDSSQYLEFSFSLTT
jgi:hypothetical protein